MKVLNDVLGYENLKIYQDLDYFCFSLDSVMLANFATVRLRDNNICDIGTGNGIVPLILSKRCNKKIIGVEIQEKLSELAKESVIYNKVDDQISIINCDVLDSSKFDYNEYFDLVTCNPPYFKLGEKSYLNLSEEKKLARHEITLDLERLMKVAKKILKNNGNFAIVHRPERLMEILGQMSANGIEPKRIQFVHENVDKESTLVLVEGQKCGKPGLKIENPLILYNKDGSMTSFYENFIKEVRK